MKSIIKFIVILALLIISATVAMAQENTDDEILPAAFTLSGFTYHAQTWNNCGPATLTMGLSYFGYTDGQARAAAWLKPNYEDKNVSPWQMVEYVNTQVPELPVFSKMRYGGTLETLKRLISNGFPVIIEAGYDPERAQQGWMGHYLLMTGYDDAAEQFITYDSYDGQNLPYSYEHIEVHWKHFNYTYLVLFELAQEQEVINLLGDDADELQNIVNTFEIARNQAIEDSGDAFAWFNMGSMLAEIGGRLDDTEMYEQAATAYDQAFGIGMPWRTLWYQFGPYEAYLAVGEYDTVLELVNNVRNAGGGQYVEETFYYAARAREAMGETDRAITNYNSVLQFNPNFAPARERRDALTNG